MRAQHAWKRHTGNVAQELSCVHRSVDGYEFRVGDCDVRFRMHVSRYERDIDAHTNLPPTHESVGAARSFIDSILGAWHVQTPLDIARLLTSELVTNTVVHAKSDVDLHVSVDCDRVRVEIHDSDATVPTPRRAPMDSLHGRGLQIVANLASAWGVAPDGDGKVVWFELPTEIDRPDEPATDSR